MGEDARGLSLMWSPIYRSEWDTSPGRYVDEGVVAWGRSRRLARAEDMGRGFKAYLGVQHFDPAQWHAEGESRATFFLSLFLDGRTVTVRTYPTIPDALRVLEAFHAGLTGQR